MITPRLENDILDGKAVYRTFNTGTGGVFTIPCPSGGFIVLTDFIWYPFIDVAFDASLLWPQIQARSVKQMQLRAGDNNVNYVFRDHPTLVGTAEGEQFIELPNPMQVHCLHKFTQDVYVDVKVIPDVTQWGGPADYSPLNNLTGEYGIPNGYGIAALPSLKTFVCGAGGFFFDVLGNKRSGIDASSGGGQYTEEFQASTNLATVALNDPTGTQQNSSYPILVFGFVQYNSVPTPQT